MTQSHSMNYFSSFTKLPRSKRHNLCIKIFVFGNKQDSYQKSYRKVFSIAFFILQIPIG